MFGNSKQLEAENETLKSEVERLKKELEKAEKTARENWKKYESCFYEAQNNSVPKQDHDKLINEWETHCLDLENESQNLEILLDEERENHAKTQNILDRKKQQCKRYKNKIEKLQTVT